MKFNKLMIPILVLSTFTTMCSKSKDKNSDIKFSNEKIIDNSSSIENEISEKIKSNNVYRDPTSFKLISMKDAYSDECYKTYVVSYTYGQGMRYYNLIIYTNGKFCTIMDWESNDTSSVPIFIDTINDMRDDSYRSYVKDQCIFCN